MNKMFTKRRPNLLHSWRSHCDLIVNLGMVVSSRELIEDDDDDAAAVRDQGGHLLAEVESWSLRLLLSGKLNFAF